MRRLHPADDDADAAAQAGADRSAAALRFDLRASLADLETAWRALDDSQWDELDRRLRTLRGRADDAELLAWLLGRGPAPTLGPW